MHSVKEKKKEKEKPKSHMVDTTSLLEEDKHPFYGNRWCQHLIWRQKSWETWWRQNYILQMISSEKFFNIISSLSRFLCKLRRKNLSLKELVGTLEAKLEKWFFEANFEKLKIENIKLRE